MHKFRNWLNSNPGMANQLLKDLPKAIKRTVNATCVSNVKHERRLMPPLWMPTVARLSDGVITMEYLVTERNRLELKLNKRVL
jgi:hypothetical protein